MEEETIYTYTTYHDSPHFDKDLVFLGIAVIALSLIFSSRQRAYWGSGGAARIP
ncbi:MAG: hypothetical protein IJ071_01280 [Ruminococcus sp.]|nr:hypothetical protein [Ruminococcus sp.]